MDPVTVGLVILAGIVGFVLGARWAWGLWDVALRTFEGDGDHDGSPWYRMARRIP